MAALKRYSFRSKSEGGYNDGTPLCCVVPMVSMSSGISCFRTTIVADVEPCLHELVEVIEDTKVLLKVLQRKQREGGNLGNGPCDH